MRNWLAGDKETEAFRAQKSVPAAGRDLQVQFGEMDLLFKSASMNSDTSLNHHSYCAHARNTSRPEAMRREFLAVGPIDIRTPPENRRGFKSPFGSSASPSDAGCPSMISRRSSGKEGMEGWWW
jgi:hypothetical protein